MQIVHLVFSWFVNFCGSIFVYGAIIAAILILIERILYSARRRDDADKTASQAASPASSRRIALITGASSGLGRNLALEMDKNEKGIDEFWLIARRKEKLEALAAELHHPSHILSLDLTLMESSAALAKELQEANVEVGVLVNCAGLGKIGNYRTLTVEENNQMIDLNDRAAVDVTMTCLPFMKAGDRILEICSTAAFQPFQHLNVYAASKAFLYSYSRALRMELLPRGIVVTAVCPYWMKDTEFIAGAESAYGPGERPAIRNFAFGVPSGKVASRAMRDSRAGLAVSTPGFVCTIHRAFAKLLPKSVLLYIWELIRGL